MRAKALFMTTAVLAAVALGFYVTQKLDSAQLSDRVSAESGVSGTVLVNSEGQTFRLADTGGKWLILFFGYASCPDVCPMSLAYLNRELAAAGAASEQFQPIFISVDPKRDRPEVLKGYVGAFSKRIIGATGSEEALQALSKKLGVYYEVESQSAEDLAAGNYTIVHSGAFFIVSPGGKLVKTISPPQAPGALSQAMAQLKA